MGTRDDKRTRLIKMFCRMWGLERYAEDAAQEDLAARARGLGANQAARYAAIDSLIRIGVFNHPSQPRPPAHVSLDAVEHAYALEAQALQSRDDGGSGLDPGDLDRLRAAIRTLRPKQRRAVELTLEGKDRKTVGREMGLTESRASQLMKGAVLRMRTVMGVEMEMRKCKYSKCGNEWKCARHSTSRYCSVYCQVDDTGKAYEPNTMRRKKPMWQVEGKTMVNRKELAEHAGKSPGTIDAYVKKGVIVQEAIEETARPVYNLEEAMEAIKANEVGEGATEEPAGASYRDPSPRRIGPRKAKRLKDQNADLQMRADLGAIPTTEQIFAKKVAQLAREAPSKRLQLQLLRVSVEAAGFLSP